MRHSTLNSPNLSTALKLVSAAGVAPAVAPSRTEHVAATPRAVCPGVIRKDAGDLFFVGSESLRPWTATRGEIVLAKSGAPSIARLEREPI